jgi:hypothetical protein
MSMETTMPKRSADVRNWIRLVKFCAVGVVGVSMLVGAARWIIGPVISARTLESIHGATRDDVLRILGEPSEMQSQGDWIYDRPPTAGWVKISFGENGRVQLINDEQACPGLFDNGSSWEQ